MFHSNLFYSDHFELHCRTSKGWKEQTLSCVKFFKGATCFWKKPWQSVYDSELWEEDNLTDKRSSNSANQARMFRWCPDGCSAELFFFFFTSKLKTKTLQFPPPEHYQSPLNHLNLKCVSLLKGIMDSLSSITSR